MDKNVILFICFYEGNKRENKKKMLDSKMKMSKNFERLFMNIFRC